MYKIAIILVSLLAFVLAACGSGPPHYICKWDAERYIKGELAFPATYDEHQLDTTRAGLKWGEVTENEVGWLVESVILFGAKNAFGVQQNYAFRYMADVYPDDHCGPIISLELSPY